METSLKTGFAQIFSSCPKKSELPKIWGGCSPPRPPGPYAYASFYVPRPSCVLFVWAGLFKAGPGLELDVCVSAFAFSQRLFLN